MPLYHIFALTRELPGVHADRRTEPADHQSARHARLRQGTGAGAASRAITGVNTLFNGLLNTPGFDELDFSHLHLTLGGGMAVQRAVAERWKKVTGCTLVEAYGLTETSPAACINPLDSGRIQRHRSACRFPSTDVCDSGRRRQAAAARRSRRTVRTRSAGDEGLLAAPRRDRQGAQRPMAGCTPATSRRWTRRATSTSSTARRT